MSAGCQSSSISLSPPGNCSRIANLARGWVDPKETNSRRESSTLSLYRETSYGRGLSERRKDNHIGPDETGSLARDQEIIRGSERGFMGTESQEMRPEIPPRRILLQISNGERWRREPPGIVKKVEVHERRGRHEMDQGTR
jgi:hypothetical protein